MELDLATLAAPVNQELENLIQDKLRMFVGKVNEGMAIERVYEECGIVGEVKEAFDLVLTRGRDSGNINSVEYWFFLYQTKAIIMAQKDAILESARTSGHLDSVIESLFGIWDGWLKKYLEFCKVQPMGSVDAQFYADYKRAGALYLADLQDVLVDSAKDKNFAAAITAIKAKLNQNYEQSQRPEPKTPSITVNGSNGSSLKVTW